MKKRCSGILGIVLSLVLLIGCGEKKETTSLADLYRNRAEELIAAGDYETANAALEEGIRVTQDESLSEMLQTIRDQSQAREAQTEEADAQAEIMPSATAAPTQTPSPSPTPTATPKPSPSLAPEPSLTPMSAVSLEECGMQINEALSRALSGFEVSDRIQIETTYDQQEKWFLSKVTLPYFYGIAAEAYSGNQESMNTWKDMSQLFLNLQSQLQEILNQDGYADYEATISVYGEERPEQVLLLFYQGAVSFDAVQEAISERENNPPQSPAPNPTQSPVQLPAWKQAYLEVVTTFHNSVGGPQVDNTYPDSPSYYGLCGGFLADLGNDETPEMILAYSERDGGNTRTLIRIYTWSGEYVLPVQEFNVLGSANGREWNSYYLYHDSNGYCFEITTEALPSMNYETGEFEGGTIGARYLVLYGDFLYDSNPEIWATNQSEILIASYDSIKINNLSELYTQLTS